MIERADASGVIHQFPDGTSEAVIQRVTGTSHAVPTSTRQAPAAPSSKTQPVLDNALGAALQGLSMGFSDEAIAKARSMMDRRPQGGSLSSLVTGQPVPGSYEDYLQAQRQGMSKYSEENPITSTAAEIGGSLLLPGGIIKTGGMKAGKALAPSIMRMMGIGAATGAVSGAGGSEKKDLGGVAEDAALGAVTGAGATGMFSGLGRYVVKPSWDKVKVGMGWTDPNNAANLAIAKALKLDGHNPSTVQNVVDSLGRGEITLADLGENMRALLKKATQAPGETRNKALSVLAERADQRVPRVSEDLQGLLSGSKDFYTDLEQMIKARSAKAEPLYEAAYANAKPITPQTTKHLDEMSKAPSFQEAMRAGMKRAADLGLDLSDPKNILRGLHETKVALDDMIKAKMLAGETNQARTLIDMKKRLLHDMETSSPDYATARKAFAGDSEIIDAMNNGKDIYKLTEPEMRKLLLSKVDNPSELDAMRAGIAQAMLERLRASPDARPIRSVLGNDTQQLKLKLAFHDDNAFDQFKNRLLSEEKMILTERQGVKATPTEMPESGGPDLVSAARSAAGGNFGSAAMNIYNSKMPAITGMPAKVAAPTAEKILTPTGPKSTGLDPVLTSIMDSLKQEEQDIVKRGAMSKLAAAGTGTLAGSKPPTLGGGGEPPPPEVGGPPAAPSPLQQAGQPQ
jgi:hypothetical protein